MRLTEAGEAVLPYARAALDAVAGAGLAVQELTGLVRGRVAIGTVTSLGADMDVPRAARRLPPTLTPASRSRSAEDTSDRLLAGLLDGRYDLAFAGLAGDAPPGVDTQTVIDDALAAAVAPGDPLAGEALGAAEPRWPGGR